MKDGITVAQTEQQPGRKEQQPDLEKLAVRMRDEAAFWTEFKDQNFAEVVDRMRQLPHLFLQAAEVLSNEASSSAPLDRPTDGIQKREGDEDKTVDVRTPEQISQVVKKNVIEAHYQSFQEYDLRVQRIEGELIDISDPEDPEHFQSLFWEALRRIDAHEKNAGRVSNLFSTEKKRGGT